MIVSDSGDAQDCRHMTSLHDLMPTLRAADEAKLRAADEAKAAYERYQEALNAYGNAHDASQAADERYEAALGACTAALQEAAKVHEDNPTAEQLHDLGPLTTPTIDIVGKGFRLQITGTVDVDLDVAKLIREKAAGIDLSQLRPGDCLLIVDLDGETTHSSKESK